MIGETLAGRYHIASELGRGGMGVVYKARDTERNMDVAIKTIPPDLAHHREFLQRFQQEARALMRLHHPHIVGLIDLVQDQGNHYMVLEYVDGPSLSQVLTKGPLPPARAREIALQVCDALTHAHEHNIVHRDIKPSNILLTKEGQVKVTDFGIARVLDATLGTLTGKVFGTARYASPEQVKGLKVDPRSDLYSLGVVLYEMLTGRPPFLGTDDEIMEQHVRARPVTPREWREEIPEGLESIVLRCLEKDRESRYQTAQELAADLRAGELATEPAIAKRKLEGDGGKRKLIMAFALVASLLLLGLLALRPAVQRWLERRGDLASVSPSADATPGQQPSPTGTVPGSSLASTPGPTLNSWIPVGLQGIPVEDLVLSPDFENDQTIFAASGGNYACGVYKSSDAGHSWTRMTSGLTSRQASAIAVSPDYVHDRTLLVGTYYGGILRSPDGGQSWQLSSNGLPQDQRGTSARVCGLAFSPAYAEDGTVFASVDSGSDTAGDRDAGIYMSTDGGAFWRRVADLNPYEMWWGREQSFAFSPQYATDSTIAVATGWRVLQSTDRGNSWQAITIPLSASQASITSLAFSPNYGGDKTIFAGTDSGLYKSIDGGASWQLASVGLPNGGAMRGKTVAVAPSYASNRTVLVSGEADWLGEQPQSGGFFISADGGDSWNPINKGWGARDLRALVVDPLDEGVFYAAAWEDGGGVWRYQMGPALMTDAPIEPRGTPVTPIAGTGSPTPSPTQLPAVPGISWARSGLPDAGVHHLTVDQSSPSTVYAGTCNMGAFKSTDGGQTWKQIKPPDFPQEHDSHLVVPDPLDPGTVYIAAEVSGVFRSTDGGQTWASLGFSGDVTTVSALTMAIDPINPQNLYLGLACDHIQKSTDGGQTWAALQNSPLNVGVIVVNPQDPSIVYASADDFSGGGGVYQSTDGGLTWRALAWDLGGYQFAVHAKDPNVIYSWIYPGLGKSTDGGQTWTRVGGNVPQGMITAMTLDPVDPDTLYVAHGDRGIYRSTDGGSTWMFMGSMGDEVIVSLAVTPSSPQTVYASTIAHDGMDAVWRATLPEVTSTTGSLPKPQGRIAFVSDRDGNNEIYVMNADGSGLMDLTNHQANDTAPAWSPNGDLIAFESDRDGNWEIYVMNANGGGVTRLTNHPASDFTPAWSPDGAQIAFVSDRYGEFIENVYVMEADGSNPIQMTPYDGAATWISALAWSPIGGRLLYTVMFGVGYCYGVEIISTSGASVASVQGCTGSGLNAASWSRDGTRIAVSLGPSYYFWSDIYAVNSDGTGRLALTQADQSLGSGEHNLWPAWSPDGGRIAFSSDKYHFVRENTQRVGLDILVMNADGSGEARLSSGRSSDRSPTWSPDGTRIAFLSDRDGNDEIYTVNPDGSDLRRLTNDPASDRDPAWSPR